MSRLSCVAVLLPAVLGVAVVPMPAGADPIGGVVLILGSGDDLVAIPWSLSPSAWSLS